MPVLQQSEEFLSALELLEFQGEQHSSLQFVKDIDYVGLSASEIFGLETARSFEVDAVYFRKFADDRAPRPDIYIYDNTNNQLSTDRYAEIQRVLWSSCIIPIFLIIERSRVLIFDSRKPVDTSFFGQITASPIETLSLTSSVLKEYSARLFDNGSFWERDKAANHFLESTSAYNDLLSGLKKIRKSFLEHSNLPPRTAHKLLVLSILIKYLEERGTDGETLFAKNFFQQFGANDFCGVLRNKGQIVHLFAKLSERFNGKVFYWEDKSEIQLLAKCDLSILANFLDANVDDSNQYVLWRRYSFAHLPVELISSVYEEFLGEKSDVVYTPHYLVNTLVDECMPLNNPHENFKLIDGSCGSGIFLVVAYKRLVEWWRFTKFKEHGVMPRNPNLTTLKSLLKASIYGVDIEEGATHLTIFSLALALCDMLTPKQIWTELTFDDLSVDNIIAQDFFHHVSVCDKKFDLVIGNPPFIEWNQNEFDLTISENNLDLQVKIPQNQTALLFLDQAMTLLKLNASLCLVMPSGPLLYNDTMDFRKYFFEKYETSQIIDFTHLSAILFGKASVATAAIFVSNRKPKCPSISHITVRRTKPSKEKIFFEIDHYDFHQVNIDDAISERNIWKANLLGGGRLNYLINRLSDLETLGSYLKSQKKNNNWTYGDGFIKGKDDKLITKSDLVKKKGGYIKADYLTNSLCFNPEDFDENGIAKRYRLKDVYFQWPRNSELFQGPVLLIKKNIGVNSIPVHLSKNAISFKNEVVGIHAPASDKAKLEHIQNVIKDNQTYRFYLSVTSARSGVSRSISTLLQEDVLNLPFPDNLKDLELSYAEKILRDDVLKYTLMQLSKGENAGINGVAAFKEIKQFGGVFCKALNSIYKEGTKEFSLSRIVDSESFYALTFTYQAHTKEIEYLNNKKAESNIINLATSQGKNLRVNRIIKIYEKDKIHLIKLKQIRYWLKSIALRDADETFNDLANAGY